MNCFDTSGGRLKAYVFFVLAVVRIGIGFCSNESGLFKFYFIHSLICVILFQRLMDEASHFLGEMLCDASSITLHLSLSLFTGSTRLVQSSRFVRWLVVALISLNGK